MGSVNKTNESFSDYITNPERFNNISGIKMSRVVDVFSKAIKNNSFIDNNIANISEKLVKKKITFYSKGSGRLLKILSAVKNLFKYGDMSNTALIAQKRITAHNVAYQDWMWGKSK